MKKEEFATYLNEQPSIIFGRTGRELMVVAIGLSISYLVWGKLNAYLPSANAGVLILKIGASAIPSIVGLIVALTKIASRPLEEWAFIGLFYLLIPKVYIYMAIDVEELGEKEENAKQEQLADQSDETDDYY
jgi:hypothetical protein